MPRYYRGAANHETARGPGRQRPAMRTRFDELGKEVGKAALGPLGPTAAQDGISSEIQYADLRHEPDPTRAADRMHLGLLGRLASSPCLLELYARAPDDAEFRACLGKHIAHWQRRARAARTRAQPHAAALVAPFLWILAAGTPASLMNTLALAPATGWPAGVYLFGGDVLRVGLIAANQLPRERSTLLVRLMAAGPLLRHAIEELSALPADAPERTVADPILLRFQHALGLKPNRTPEEEEFVVRMYSSWEEAREEGREQGRKEGQELARKEGQKQGHADALLTVLRARGIAVPDTERARILTEDDPDRLKRWLERAVVAASLAEVLHEPS